jgi:hypothetical protein
MTYLPESGCFDNLQCFFFEVLSCGQTAVVCWKDAVFIAATKNQVFAGLFYRNLMSMTSPGAGASENRRLALGLGLMS